MRYARSFVVASACALRADLGESQEALPAQLPSEGFVARPIERTLDTPKERAGDVRNDALARAAVWAPPAVPPSAANLGANPGPFPDPAVCKFEPSEASGSTPKFDCVFESGEVLKVKYGKNPEIHSEAAATRLLAALGFGADRIYLVRTLRCFGCPSDPHAAKVGAATDAGFVDFQNVAVERRLPGKAIEGEGGDEGWDWEDLDEAQAPGRGAKRAQRDALRLMAVLLNNWDSRSDNQRLLCLPEGYPPGRGGHCGKALAYMHDVGGTFGRVGGDSKDERKLDVDGWSAVPVWQDRPSCTVRIKSPRLHHATFGEALISERGRRLLADLLNQLTPAQLQDLFAGSWVSDYPEATPASEDASRWAAALQDKIRQIAEGPPCPTQ